MAYPSASASASSPSWVSEVLAVGTLSTLSLAIRLILHKPRELVPLG